jgi:hypothetical protein
LSVLFDNLNLGDFNMKQLIMKSLTLVLAIAVWSVYSTISFAAPKSVNGEISVTGSVTVDGQNTISSATIFSGSTITTGSNSSAIVSLGKLGKVELLADTTLMLKFGESNITGILSAGKLQVSNMNGISTTVTTKDAIVIADSAQSNVFTVEVACADTVATTLTGLVTMRNGSLDKQVAAGTDASVGIPSQAGCKPCLRPGGVAAPLPLAGLGVGALVALLVGAAGAIGTAVVVGTGRGSNDTTIGGGIITVSPVR